MSEVSFSSDSDGHDDDTEDDDHDHVFVDDDHDHNPEDVDDTDSEHSFSDMSEISVSIHVQVPSLQDLAANVTALHMDCDNMTELSQRFTLDEHLLTKICAKSFPKDEQKLKALSGIGIKSHREWHKAEKIVSDGRILHSRQVGLLLITQIKVHKSRKSPANGIARTTVKCGKQRFTEVSCSQCPDSQWCRHSLAAILQRMRYPEKVLVSAPLTDVLSSFTRDELQKLIQYTVFNGSNDVLLHLYQTVDKMRDSESLVRQSQGAPDPTFESNEDTDKNIWENTVEDLNKNLYRRADSCWQSDFELADCVNDFRDMNTKWYDEFTSRITSLIHSGELEMAGKVLATLATSAFVGGYQSNRPGKENLQRFSEALEVWCTCFILSFGDKGREAVIEVARDLHRKSKLLYQAGEFEDIPLVTDLRSIRIPSQKLNRMETSVGTHSCLFLNAVCASEIENLSPNMDFTLIDEPLPVMIYRFEAILLFELAHNKRQWVYGIWLLRKILHLTRKLSIISYTDAAIGEESRLKSDKCRVEIEAGPSKPKIRKIESAENTDIEGLSHVQLHIVLQYVCFNMYNTLRHSHPDETRVLIEATLRMMELRNTTNLSDFRQEYDCNLLAEIIDCYQCKFLDTDPDQDLTELYTMAFLNRFNNEAFPHGPVHDNRLLNFLIEHSSLDLKLRAQLWGYQICSALTYFNSDGRQISVMEMQDMARYMLDLTSEDPDLDLDLSGTIIKVLEACFQTEDMVRVRIVLDAFLYDSCLLKYPYEYELVLKILLKPSVSEDDASLCSKERAFMKLQVYGDRIGIQYPLIVFQNWNYILDYFNCTLQSKIFTTAMNALITEDVPLPELEDDFVQSLHHLGLPSNHNIDCMDLLEAISRGPRPRQDLVCRTISYNCGSHSCHVLFFAAKMAEESNTIQLPRFDVVCQAGYELLQKAVDKYHNISKDIDGGNDKFEVNRQIHDIMVWFFVQVSNRGTQKNATGKQFVDFVHSVTKVYMYKKDKDLEEKFLSIMNKSKPLWKQVTQIRTICSREGSFNPDAYFLSLDDSGNTFFL